MMEHARKTVLGGASVNTKLKPTPCFLAGHGNGRWQRRRDWRCFSASDAAFSLGMAAQVEVQSPQQQRVILRRSWGSLEESGDLLDDTPPPTPPRASTEPLKINTDLRLVSDCQCKARYSAMRSVPEV